MSALIEVGGPRSGSMAQASDHVGLRGAPPWRSIPLWVSNDRAEAYFEIYPVALSPMPLAQDGMEEWRWRLCMPDGRVRASGGAYASAGDCLEAVNALRDCAGAARVRHVDKD